MIGSMSKPTKPGYFWHRCEEYEEWEPVKIVVSGDGNLWAKDFNGYSWSIDDESIDDEWNGECV
jgi:hypothetical protein